MRRRTVLKGAAAGVALGASGWQATAAAAGGSGVGAVGGLAVLPAVREWVAGSGQFRYAAQLRLVVAGADAGLLEAAETFADDLRALTGTRPPVVSGTPRSGDVVLALGATDAQLGAEGYRMVVADTLRIEGRTVTGVFFGTRTVLQLLRQATIIPGGTVRDWPQYPERGLLVANEMFRPSVQWWRERIRELAFLKLNMLWFYVGYPNTSLTELQAVAEFAARYRITVVPQLNMPGHLQGLLTGRPELHLANRPQSLDVGDTTQPLAQDWAQARLRELVPAFDTPYWHAGADEYMIFGNYADYPHLRTYARQHYHPQAEAVDCVYGFVNDVNRTVRGLGRQTRIWNDGLLVNPRVTVDQDILVEHWQESGRKATELLDEGYQLQNSRCDFLYYDNFPSPLFRLDARKIYDQFRVNRFIGDSADYTAHPDRVLGAKLHVWIDKVYTDGELGMAQKLYAPQRSLSQLLWGSPKPFPTYDGGFGALASSVGQAPGTTQWMTTATGLSGQSFVTSVDAEQHVFVEGTGGLRHWWYDDSLHRDDWTGGAVQGRPIGYTHGIEQHAFARGSDDALRHWSWSPGLAADLPHLDTWGAGPGTVTSAPAGYALGDQQHVFYRAANGSLEQRLYDRSDERIVVSNWGGELAGTPLAFTHGEQHHVFARTANGSLRHWYWYPGLTAIAREDWAGAGAVTSDLAGYIAGDQQHVFYRGPDGTLRHQFWDQSDRRLATENWGGELTGPPTGFVFGSEQHVFARGSDRALRHWFWPGRGTPVRDTWSEAGAMASDVTGYAVGDQQHTFYLAPDDTLKHTFWDASAARLSTETWPR